MLIKASKVIGLPVFTINDGRKIENVEDVIYDPLQNRIEALLIEKGGWFGESRVILFDDLEGIGYDAALITSRNLMRKIADVGKNIQAIVKNDTFLTNTKIITEDGIELGRVSDIYFNSSTGRVEEFEVSQGTLQNWKTGKKRIKIESLVTIGHDATIVKIYNPGKIQTDTGVQNSEPIKIDKENKTLETDKIHEQTKKLVDAVRSKTQEVVDKKDETGVKVETVKDKDAIVNKQTVENAETKIKLLERRKRDAVGLYLTKNILTPNDAILAKEGEMVTYKLLQDAETAGVLDQIFSNVAPKIMQMAI